MAGALYDAKNVVVGHAWLRLAKLTSRDATPVAMPANSVPVFSEAEADWPAATWINAGATNEGFKVTVDTSTTTITIEEQSIPVDEKIESKTLAIEAALAEDTVETIALAWGGTVTTNGAATPPNKTMVLTDESQYYTAILESKNKAGKARRLRIPLATVTGSGDTNFRRAADKRTYPVRVQSLSKPSDITIVDIT